MDKKIGWKLVYVPTYNNNQDITKLTPAVLKLSYDEADIKSEVTEKVYDGYVKAYMLITKIHVEEIYDMDMNVINPEKCLPIKHIHKVEYTKHEETVEMDHGLYVFRTNDEVFEFKKEFESWFDPVDRDINTALYFFKIIQDED